MMQREIKETDWDDLMNARLKEWYYTCKIMGTIFTPEFPYFIYMHIVQCIYDDPSYKKEGSEK